MRPEKQLLLHELQEKIEGSQALFFTRYSRMHSNLTAQFRSLVLKTGGNFTAVRKRIFVKAAEKAGISVGKGDLEGHIGIVFAYADPVQMTKALFQFRKENQDTLQVLGGRFDGKPCSAKDVEHISMLPGMDEMRGQLLGTFEAPMSQTLAVFEALLCSVMYCVEQKAQANT